jgi:putative peptide maturation system protein
MSALASVESIRINGKPIQLDEVLHSLKVLGDLENLLDQLVEDRLIADAARAEGVVLDDDELQKAADTYRQSQGLQKAAETRAWLEKHYLAIEDLQARIERPLLRRKLAEHLAQGQTERYFVENRAQFDRARLAQIVVDRDGVAAELLSQLVDDGADFAALARKYSLDTQTRQAGGLLGVVARKSLSSAIEAAVFGARPGDVVGPFQTGKGYHLIKVEEILPAQLDARTTETIRDRIFADWLRQRKLQSQVEMPLLKLV